ncbi:RidA family protein [Dorea sp. D27]|uniref:RidA family protein n=1 Tax=Dorea sp. D27 TaxID=658665 RepID=UPI000673A532|nr:RidA family protein [Dorea sp. D27]KMZ55455.1 putative endoribonuclease L-PSP [Dorea sp. D27]
MSKKAYLAEGCEKCGFPFSHATEADGVVYVSGQPSMDLVTSHFIDGTFEEQFKKCFANLDEALKAAGLTRDDVVKCTVFLIDMRDFPAMNKLYAEQFVAPYPARSCFSVTGLPMGARVEVEMIAHRN